MHYFYLNWFNYLFFQIIVNCLIVFIFYQAFSTYKPKVTYCILHTDIDTGNNLSNHNTLTKYSIQIKNVNII